MTKHTNAIELAMTLAWSRVKRTHSRLWTDWLIIGEGLVIGRTWAMRQAQTNRPEGEGYALAFNEWLKQHKMTDLDKSDRAKLLAIMEERAAVEEFRQTLTKQERDLLNNPTALWRKWRAWERPKRKKAAPGGARLRQINEQLQARITELEQDLEERDARIRKLEMESTAT
jgi:hypothetical protein